MARARNIKPSFFTDENLATCSAYSRLFFIGLLVFSSKEGDVTLDETILKEKIFPYMGDIDLSFVFTELESAGVIQKKNQGYFINDIRKWCVESKITNSNYHSSNRRAVKRSAMPLWANKKAIKGIYEQAKKLSSDGSNYHVDHVIPLKNPLVCGLHVESNLTIIPAEENLKKSNKFTGGKDA